MKRCSACGNQIRSGTMIFASDGKGGLARKRVGACCAKLAVPVLIGNIEASRCKCGKPASTCVACVRDDEKADPKKRFKKAIAKIQSAVDGYVATGGRKDDELQFQIAGLEQAIDILEAGDF